MSKEDICNKLVQHPRLGEILLQHKKIAIEHLDKAMTSQKLNNLPLGEILIGMDVITKDELVEVLELQSNIDKILGECFTKFKELNQNEQSQSPS